MSAVFLFGLWMQVLNVCGNSVPLEFRCPFCPCVFSSQHDLDLHLKAFDAVPHLRLWRCIHILLEEDGSDASVDERSDWHWSNVRSIHPNTVRACRDFVAKRA